MKRKVCYVINEDITIIQYEILDGVKTNQIEIIGKSKKRYIVANFKTLKEAMEFVKRMI